MAMNLFVEISIIIIAAAVIGGIARLFKQPLIIGYIITGILIGPTVLNLVGAHDSFEVFSHIAIALLLFIVGMGLNFHMLKNLGPVSLITGIGQVVFTSIFGFLIGLLLGFNALESTYIAVALTFSSTIIIMKLLSDRGDLETLYGRIAVGFLLVQDMIVIIALLVISSLSSNVSIQEFIVQSLFMLIILIGVILLFSKFIVLKIINYIAKSQEYLLLFSLAWCFLLSCVFYMFNFSIEIGALLAGITFASTPYKFEISSKLKPLRDFFLTIFFIFLGANLVFDSILSNIIPIIIFSVFILIGNPLIVIFLMGLLGYKRRTGFFAGLTVAQISEFSIILIGLGVTTGHVTKEVLSMVTAIGLITIAGSTYMIMYADKVYPLISKYLNVFEKLHKKSKEEKESIHTKEKHHDILLFGYNRIGQDVLSSLHKLKREFLVIDHNPETIIDLTRKGFHTHYGDASDIEMLGELDLEHIKMVVSTIPDAEINMLLIHAIKERNPVCNIIVIAHYIDDALAFYEAGATYVLLPHYVGGHQISLMIEEHAQDPERFLKEKIRHIEYLKDKKSKK